MSGRVFGLDLPTGAREGGQASALTRLRSPGTAARVRSGGRSPEGVDTARRDPASLGNADDRDAERVARARGVRVDIEHVVLDGIVLPDPHRQPLLLRTIREELARLVAAHPRALHAARSARHPEGSARHARLSAGASSSADPRRLGVEIARQLHRAVTGEDGDVPGGGASGAGERSR